MTRNKLPGKLVNPEHFQHWIYRDFDKFYVGLWKNNLVSEANPTRSVHYLDQIESPSICVAAHRIAEPYRHPFREVAQIFYNLLRRADEHVPVLVYNLDDPCDGLVIPRVSKPSGISVLDKHFLKDLQTSNKHRLDALLTSKADLFVTQHWREI